MNANQQLLPAEIEAAVAQQYGGPIAVPGQHNQHVVMSMAVFRDMMGVGSDQEFERSIEALNASLADAAAGRTLSLEEAAAKLTEKYGA